jgi:hypothetical protein
MLAPVGDPADTDTDGERADSEAEEAPALEQAPRGRRTLAGIIDAGVWSAPMWIAVRRMRAAEDGAAAGERAARAGQAAKFGWAVLGQQLGTPGEWIAGVRTVDRRSGRRLALWRSLAAASLALAAAELTRRARDSAEVERPDAHERERAVREIWEKHRDDVPARNAALMDYYAEHRVATPDPARWLLLPLALGLVQSRLRKRLAPTVVVVRRGRGAEG